MCGILTQCPVETAIRASAAGADAGPDDLTFRLGIMRKGGSGWRPRGRSREEHLLGWRFTDQHGSLVRFASFSFL